MLYLQQMKIIVFIAYTVIAFSIKAQEAHDYMSSDISDCAVFDAIASSETGGFILDNGSWREKDTLETHRRLYKLVKLQKQIASSAYLQARNYYNNFKYQKALEKINKALYYDSEPKYFFLRDQILTRIKHNHK